jgi:Ca2+-binding EF-hand superfamily protein
MTAGTSSDRYVEFLGVMKGVSERQGRPFIEKKVQAMFALADLNKDGSVDFPEFLVMQAQKAERGKLKAKLSDDSPDGPASRPALDTLKGALGGGSLEAKMPGLPSKGLPAPDVAERLGEVIDLGPFFLREYLKFNKHGDGRLELEQFVAVLEATLLKRGLRVFRKQLEGMFRAADFDDDGVVDWRAPAP